jgi:hypothetical protein
VPFLGPRGDPCFRHWRTNGLRVDYAQAEALARAHPNGEVLVIGVDEGEERDVVAAWLEGRSPARAIYLDPKLAVSDRLGVTELPTVIVVDREGYIRRVAGQIDAELLRLVDELVKKPEQSSAASPRNPSAPR